MAGLETVSSPHGKKEAARRILGDTDVDLRLVSLNK